MIIIVLCGFGLLVAIAVIVGVLDARHRPDLRLQAAERRGRWESDHTN